MSEDRIFWEIPARVLYMKAARDASIEIVRADSETVWKFVKAGEAPVHLLVDLSDVGRFPRDITQEMVDLLSHPMLGRVAAVGFPQFDEAIIQSALDALTQLTGKPIDLAASVADGLALLRASDPTLNS